MFVEKKDRKRDGETLPRPTGPRRGAALRTARATSGATSDVAS